MSPAADGAPLPDARLPDDDDGPAGGVAVTSASVRPVLLPMLLSERASAAFAFAFAFILLEAGGGDLEDEDDRRRRSSSLGDFIVPAYVWCER